MKETIAFAGNGEHVNEMIKKLAAAGYHLLLIVKKGDEFSHLSDFLEDNESVELMLCMKTGCWEADVIILSGFKTLEPELIEKVRRVATQKIILCMNGTPSNKLAELLPYSFVVEANIDRSAYNLSGKNQEAVENISNVFTNSGYKQKINS